jgi:hypothetical protein
MMQDRLLRAIYAIEFLLALVAVLIVWNYVGGPTHLDYVPWFWKGAMALAIATTILKVTASPSIKWFGMLTVLLIGCGLLSYYAHITEPQDQSDETEQVIPTDLHPSPI